jgi:Neutral/alkaline non-lysosomal ceramidase, N-terminal
MKIGFGRTDITPRPGVELAGFGPFLHRYSREVYQQLFARAMAASDGERTWVLLSADLCGFSPETITEARRLSAAATGLAPECLAFHATHTHSGPARFGHAIGWGEPDPPYLERLPTLLAEACRAAVEDLAEAELSAAEVPVENLCYNREQEPWPQCPDSLSPDWRPQKPGGVDKTAWVLSVRSEGKLRGFLSSYSCHAVVCGESCHWIHGDWPGVATNAIEAENPGSTGLFLLGGHGDINSRCTGLPADRALEGLELVGGMYADVIRKGIAAAGPLPAGAVGSVLEEVNVNCEPLKREDVEQRISAELEKVRSDPEGDAGHACRMAAVFLEGSRRQLAALERGDAPVTLAPMAALRAGPLLILGVPFELFRDIKERIVRELGPQTGPVLVLSCTNDFLGYAPTRATIENAADGHYARDTVPVIMGRAPFTPGLEDEIVENCLRLAAQLGSEQSA